MWGRTRGASCLKEAWHASRESRYAGGTYHVWARRVEHTELFVDRLDYERYVELLEETVEEFRWILLSFCLMPNHIHLLLQLQEPNLAAGMQKLHLNYVLWFNRRHGREGHLFERRYGAHLVEDDVYLITVIEYIESNPLNAGLCTSPEHWPWSSRGLASSGKPPGWLAHDLLQKRVAEI